MNQKNVKLPRKRTPPGGLTNRPARRAGRPSKLTPEMATRLVSALEAGAYIETAAAIAGISKVTLYQWLKTGAKDSEDGKGGTLAAGFLNAVEKAMAESEVRDLMVIQQAAEKGVWQAAAWRLERKYPDKWGRRRVELTGKEGGAIKVATAFSPEQLRRMAEEVLCGTFDPGGEIG